MKNIIKLFLKKVSRPIYHITPDEIKLKSKLKSKLENELLEEIYDYFKKHFEKV